MKEFLRSLTVSGTVGVLVTSALVVAQAPNAGPTLTTTSVTKDAADKQVKKEGQKVEVPAAPAVATPVEILNRQAVMLVAGNPQTVVEQYTRQARPLVRAELIFVRKICELDVERFRRINQDVEAELNEVVKKLVEAQQQGRLRRAGRPQMSGTVDGPSLLREALASVMKKNLPSAQFTRYQAEVEKRDAHRRLSAVRFLVDAIDRELFLSDQQREQLTESLSSHWDEGWSATLEYQFLGNQFFPAGVDRYLIPLLNANQTKAWQGHQRVMIGGLFGMTGGFMNDNDALEAELGDVTKAEPAGRVELRTAPSPKAETKKAITKEALPRNR